ncbi:MAG: phenylalanine--tRNA ligase subunit beta [Caldisericia bacterium]|nr:phenylalanine--tRNA ligase subunit beta [Caldisericia bacterium]
MKVSLNWFNEFFKLDEDIEKVKEITTFRGLEIEEIIRKESPLKNCFTGLIREIEKIDENLSLCKVDFKGEIYNSVTGAKNVKKGDIVPFAFPGGFVYKHNFKNGQKVKEVTYVKKIEIKGYESQVLLLSYDEIGLEESSLSDIYKEGIFILPKDTPLYEDLIQVLWLNDTIFEIKTLNRGDTLSLFGIAKEFERYGIGKFILNKKEILNHENLLESGFEIEIKNNFLCPRYVGIVVKGVKVNRSNISNLRKLLSIEQRPINNIVDLTNVYMFEYGQPLHAFDLDKLEKKIVVREAKEKEKIVTLDGKERELEEGMLLICDAEKPIAIAGVIGGKDTEVSFDTKNVLLESAYFNPISISKTKRKLKIDTEAGNRFEKGVDINRTLIIGFNCALDFNGEITYKPIDIYPEPFKFEPIKLRFDRARKIIGFNFKDEEIVNILNRGGFVETERGNGFSFFIPNYNRPDVKTEIDLIEEIVRYYGIEKLPYTIPSIKIDPFIDTFDKSFKEKVSNILISLGLNEIVTLSLVEKEYLLSFGFDKNLIEIVNPLRQDQNTLRISLVPTLLKVIEKNVNLGNKNLAIFEIGKIYFEDKGDYFEEEELIVGLTGKIIEKYWGEKDKFYNFYYLKGILEKLFYELNIKEFYVLNLNNPRIYHPTRFGKIIVENEEVGEIGELSEDILEKTSIKDKVYILRVELEKIKKFASIKKEFYEISKFPSLTFDLSILLPKDVKYHELLKIVKEEAKNLLYKVSLFDIYEDEKMGLDKKSFAINLIFSTNEKTLTDDDIKPIIDKIEKRVESELKGSIRKRVE